jgi:SAM-dependent methyltransferase
MTAALIYQSVNPAVLAGVPWRAKRILDIGCGAGSLGQALKMRQDCWVTGVTFSAAEARLAQQQLNQVVQADLNHFEPAELGQFDCIVCSHVLEHLVEPEQLLRRLQRCLAPQGSLLVALPNVMFWRQRLQFLLGRFRYTEGGLMDQTHLRFFDWHSAQQLLTRSGFALQSRLADGGVPFARLLGPQASQRLNRKALDHWPGLFGFQFVLCAVAKEQGGA